MRALRLNPSRTDTRLLCPFQITGALKVPHPIGRSRYMKGFTSWSASWSLYRPVISTQCSRLLVELGPRNLPLVTLCGREEKRRPGILQNLGASNVPSVQNKLTQALEYPLRRNGRTGPRLSDPMANSQNYYEEVPWQSAEAEPYWNT